MSGQGGAPAPAEAQARTRLAAARARLVMERPFLGALALQMPLAAADPLRCDTLSTDGRRLIFHAAFEASLRAAEAEFLVAHVVLHCALGHFARRGHRVRRRWEAACDHAVNLMLREDGMAVPSWAMADPAFTGLAAEEIYPLLPEDGGGAPRDRHGPRFDGGPGGGRGDHHGAQGGQAAAPASETSGAGISPRGASSRIDGPFRGAAASPPDEAPAAGQGPDGAELGALWRGRAAAAAQAGRLAGRRGDAWLRRLEGILEPALPWRALLARQVMRAARDDYSFARPRRRDGDALLPRLASGTPYVVAALDTSGSITDAELAEFTGELQALKAQARAELVVHACDERLAPEGPWRFAAWQPVCLPPRLSGGGGTRFTPVFEWIERQGLRPDLLVYFTDAQGEFPPRAPGYPVLWLVKGRAPVPFGERLAFG